MVPTSVEPTTTNTLASAQLRVEQSVSPSAQIQVMTQGSEQKRPLVTPSNLPTVAVTMAIPGPTRQPVKAKPSASKTQDTLKVSKTQVMPPASVPETTKSTTGSAATVTPSVSTAGITNGDPKVLVVQAVTSSSATAAQRNQRLPSAPAALSEASSPHTSASTHVSSQATPLMRHTSVTPPVPVVSKSATSRTIGSMSMPVVSATSTEKRLTSVPAASKVSTPVVPSVVEKKDEENTSKKKSHGHHGRQSQPPRTVAQVLKAEAAAKAATPQPAVSDAVVSHTSTLSSLTPASHSTTLNSSLSVSLISGSNSGYAPSADPISTFAPLSSVKYRGLPPITSMSSMSSQSISHGTENCNFPRLTLPPMNIGNYRQSVNSLAGILPPPMQPAVQPPPVQTPALKNVQDLPAAKGPSRQTSKPSASNGASASIALGHKRSNTDQTLRKGPSPALSPRRDLMSPMQQPRQSPDNVSNNRMALLTSRSHSMDVQSSSNPQQLHHHNNQQANQSQQQAQQQQQQQQQQQLGNYSAESLIGPPIVQFPLRSSSHLNSSYSAENLLQPDSVDVGVSLSSAGSPTYISGKNHSSACSTGKTIASSHAVSMNSYTYSTSPSSERNVKYSSSHSQQQSGTTSTYAPYNLDNFSSSNGNNGGGGSSSSNSSNNYCSPIQQNNNFVSGMNSTCDYFAPRNNSTPDYGLNSGSAGLSQSMSMVNSGHYHTPHGHNHGFHPQPPVSLGGPGDFAPPPLPPVNSLNLHEATGHLMNNFVPPPVTPVPPSFLAPSAGSDKGPKQSSSNIFGLHAPPPPPTSKCPPPPPPSSSYAPMPLGTGSCEISTGDSARNGSKSSSAGSSSKAVHKTRPTQPLDTYPMSTPDRSSAGSTGLSYFDFNMTPSGGSFNNCGPTAAVVGPPGQKVSSASQNHRVWPPVTPTPSSADTGCSSYLFSSHGPAVSTRPAPSSHGYHNPPANISGSNASGVGQSTTNFNLSNIFPDIGSCGQLQGAGSVGSTGSSSHDSLYGPRHPPPVGVLPPNAFNSILPPPRHSGSASRSSSFGLFD